MRPKRPLLSRKATSSSPSSFTRTGSQSGAGSSSESSTGSQNRRSSSPIGVPGPTCVSRSLSAWLSMLLLLLGDPSLLGVLDEARVVERARIEVLRGGGAGRHEVDDCLQSRLVGGRVERP